MNGPTPTEGGPERPSPVQTLAQRLEESLDSRGTALSVPFVSRVVSDVARELDRLHAGGSTHGDVQASRIAVPSRGTACLGEQGLASLLAPGSVGGDVAGLVAAAYHALCGVQPSYFRTLSLRDGASQGRPTSSFLVSPLLHRSDLPLGVADVLMKGLSPQVSDRYASVGEFAAALREAAGLDDAPAPASALRNRNRLATAALASCLALLAGVWLGYRPAHLPRPPQASPAGNASPSQTAIASSTPALSHAARNGAPAAHLVRKPPAAADTRLLSPHGGPLRTATTNGTKPMSAKGYLRVYARQSLSVADVQEHRARLVRPMRVLIDGCDSRSLTTGRWASLPPGPHRVAFYPAPGLPFDANTMFRVDVEPNRRHAVQIPLPRHPGGVQSPEPKKRLLSPV